MTYPRIIQGGMGIGVSDWSLARAVGEKGQLGVVSGTGVWLVVSRRLQDGDSGGHLRRAAAHFPNPLIADAILNRFFIPGGKPPKTPYRLSTVLTHPLSSELSELIAFSNFVTVWLAKEGHSGPIGVNYLEKIQLSHLPGLYGALLAGAQYISMGAGIPTQLKEAVAALSEHRSAHYRLKVDGAGGSDVFTASFDPSTILGPEQQAPLRMPLCLAIISSNTLGKMLANCVDGFIVEWPTAGGHNAPPRSKQIGQDGEPLYGPRDEVDINGIRDLGLPFWLAGSKASSQSLSDARNHGAEGIQAGSIFALCRESSLREDLKLQIITEALAGTLDVRANPYASPSGYPFQEARLAHTIGDRELYEARERVCDLGCMRTPYLKGEGALGYRCPAEPVDQYVKKGGNADETVGKKCLCNHLTATIGLGQYRAGRDGAELPLVTFGKDCSFLKDLTNGELYSAAAVLDYLLGGC